MGPFGQALRVSDAVGTFAIVFVLPEDINLTSGSPRHHRNFLDIYLSQFSPEYLADLLEYQKILRQRNALLRKLKGGDRSERTHLDSWDESLLRPAARIMARRAVFIAEISPRVSQLASRLSGLADNVEIAYLPSLKIADPSDAAAMSTALRKERPRDLKLGVTVVGPHRDLIDIKLNGDPLRNFGSLGQKKSIVIALKLAAFDILSRHRGEPSILVLDEAFATLDKVRSQALLGLLAGLGQVFLASAQDTDLGGLSQVRMFSIIGGSVKREDG